VRRGLLVAVALLSVVSSASAARRDLGVHASATDGAAPLEVTFASVSPVHWDFGDGTDGEGTTVAHTYAAGRWTATWSAGGESGTISIVAHGIELTGPQRARFQKTLTLRGRVVPSEGSVPVVLSDGVRVLRTTSRSDGTYATRTRLARGGTWHATTPIAASNPLAVNVVPQLRTGLVGSGARGTRLLLAATVHPRGAGSLHVVVTRGSGTVVDHVFGDRLRLKLDTRRLTTYRVTVRVEPNDGFTPAAHTLRASVVLPRLGYGVRSAAVAQLAQRLRELHYAAPATTAFDTRILDAVYAFEKVQGLPRTGVADAAFWRRLGTPRTPVPRYAHPSAHLEVDKQHQVLYVVRGSHVALIVPVSTAGLPGKFTPVGRFAIYRKVTGFDPSPLGTLYDPMYFTGGYAIHGNPSVPPYPASHGCVRVPMWMASYLYATNPYGETVYVY
jgi:lipoprotein-anchoring transpeptidase ErfK/SrfK